MKSIVTVSPAASRKLLLDLREVPMLRHAVGPHALVALGVKVVDLRVPPRAAHAAHRVTTMLCGLMQPPRLSSGYSGTMMLVG